MFHPTSNLLFRLIRPHFLNNMDFFLLKKEKKKKKKKKDYKDNELNGI